MNTHLERCKQAIARDLGYHAAMDWLSGTVDKEPVNPYANYTRFMPIEDAKEWRREFDDTVRRVREREAQEIDTINKEDRNYFETRASESSALMAWMQKH